MVAHCTKSLKIGTPEINILTILRSNALDFQRSRWNNKQGIPRSDCSSESESESELFTGDTSKDNHSPGPVFREVSP